MPGPAPTPKHILEMKGSKHAKYRDELGDLRSSTPEPPDFLTDAAKDHFTETCGHLISMGTLAESDLMTVARYAAVLDRYISAETALRDLPEKYIPVTKADGTYSNAKPVPEMMQAAEAADQLHKLEHVLGLTPADRTRLGKSNKKPVGSPMSDLLRQAKEQARARKA